jgi:hypothetical protein
VSIALALYVLATVDAAFCGYRAAAGRNALIAKRRYYVHAMLRGALWGQAAVAVAGAALAAFILSDADPADAWRSAVGAGRRMLAVYLPYAAVILAAFAVRTLPSVDLRSLTSTVVFGPLTLLRPLAAAAGVAWGVGPSGRPELAAIGILVLGLMLGMEPFLGLRYQRERCAPREGGEPGTVPRPGTTPAP